ncbi:hypothetical protein VRHSUH09_00045 [Veillonella rogosae JCM 15642]|uniref:Uncharacterized protein n=1 Tax=Veillonella rogosae JCM 15642 TaxID=1298595 RepID=A0ABX5C0I6_9FIRM|nr:hypothetical protein VRHSUH09_00045 [Veillonella rogosae JCM 15642]
MHKTFNHNIEACAVHMLFLLLSSAHKPFRLQKNPCPYWHVVTAKMDGNLSQKEIMEMVHFLGSITKIM